jgi:2'-5' RNA ligase
MDDANMTESRFAFYLIPPYKVARDVVEIHSLLRKQFGLVAADNFQVHCTIKGFFKKINGPLEPLIANLDSILMDQKPLNIELSGVKIGSKSIVMDISKTGDSLNSQLLAFRDQVVNVVRPYIAPDCDFVAADLGNPFRGHITLAFNDIPVDLKDQILSFLDEAPVPKGSFVANTFHLLEYYSDNWEGPWWETLTWKLHKSWMLGKRK